MQPILAGVLLVSNMMTKINLDSAQAYLNTETLIRTLGAIISKDIFSTIGLNAFPRD